MKHFAKIKLELETRGLLLKVDSALPNVCALVAGGTVHGSWWSHRCSREIFAVLNEIAAWPDILVVKLVSGKDTFVHRNLWESVLAIGIAREAWQMDNLKSDERDLLAEVDRVGEISATGPGARRLEQKLLVNSEQYHTSSGHHAKRLCGWNHWAAKRSYAIAPFVHLEPAREKIEAVLRELNKTFRGNGTLPWKA